MDGNKAIFGVHAHRDLIAVLLQHPGRELKIRHGHAAQDAAPHAEGEIFFDPLLGADAAAHLDVIALSQADDLTIPQVNGGIEFHDISSQFCKRL